MAAWSCSQHHVHRLKVSSSQLMAVDVATGQLKLKQQQHYALTSTHGHAEYSVHFKYYCCEYHILHGAGGGGFFFTCEDFGTMFHHSSPVCAPPPTPKLFFFFWKWKIAHTLIPLFRPGSVLNFSANWDDFGRLFPDKLRVSSFPDRFPPYARTAA